MYISKLDNWNKKETFRKQAFNVAVHVDRNRFFIYWQLSCKTTLIKQTCCNTDEPVGTPHGLWFPDLLWVATHMSDCVS